jgi:hypothetical protein
LRPGLAVILAAVAVKLLLADVVEFPAWSAPAFITVVLAAAASLRGTRPRAEPALPKNMCPGRVGRFRSEDSRFLSRTDEADRVGHLAFL